MSNQVARNPFSVVRWGSETLYQFGARGKANGAVHVTHETGDFEAYRVVSVESARRNWIGTYDASSPQEALELAGYSLV